MMSASTRRFSTKIYTYCQVCILLVYVQQINSDSGSVSKEGLLEEHLLPVRMTRQVAAPGGFEGSGDEELVPIHTLGNGVMERMTLKTDDTPEEDNRILESSEAADDAKSKESIEAAVEGSGFEDPESKSTTIPVTEKEVLNKTTNNEDEIGENEPIESSTAKEEIITMLAPKVDVTEISSETTTAKQEESSTLTETTEAETEITTLLPVTFTTAKETVLPEITTEVKVEETDATTTVKPETTTLTTTVTEEVTTPIAIIAKEEVTETEKESVTEMTEVKKVQPVMAESPAEGEIRTSPEVTTMENDTLLENVNLTAGTGTLLMKSDSRFLDTNEKVLESSKDPSRLGTYIVISLILLSFLSLIGFILMKRRVQKRRKKSNIDPETLDTEKALLSLSEYKDHPDGVDEGKIKNNEITPIVIKSNTQINKFEKNTNFSSPKNLNTKANEKNVEKENVLRKASDNLTQVIIEDGTKDVEEEKAQSNAEKLIVRTHLDQDSIPKKPVIVNRTSLGCVPVPQD